MRAAPWRRLDYAAAGLVAVAISALDGILLAVHRIAASRGVGHNTRDLAEDEALM
ncbi:hypothetical protein Apa02nite_081930 [Actinoplanes palleronii]|uniref:Uncharacterized protein n=1 Tax=Actinoplanes palleronii TaxID=113570 RepID=A0ABQ4BPC9_9ACTN|nr:hypothetical protein Apa02nite_081930 [Actinoplanes palleronii]